MTKKCTIILAEISPYSSLKTGLSLNPNKGKWEEFLMFQIKLESILSGFFCLSIDLPQETILSKKPHNQLVHLDKTEGKY